MTEQTLPTCKEARALAKASLTDPILMIGLLPLSNCDRKGNEGERKYNQRDDCHDNPPGAQRFHLFGRWMMHSQHDRQQYRVKKAAWAAVPKISQ